MTPKQQILNQASNARRNNDWNKAAELYGELVKKYDDCNDWTVFFYAFALFKINKTGLSIDVCRKFYRNNKKFDPINSLYAKNINAIVLKNAHKADLEKVIKAVKAVLLLTPDIKSPNYRTDYWINQTLILLMQQNQFAKAAAIAQIPPTDRFRDKEQKIIINDKTVKIASELEKFFVNKAKIFFKTQNYGQAVDVVNQAFKRIKKFHYNNHIWLKRVKATALAKDNQIAEALRIYFEIIRSKQDWFLYFELAQLLKTANYPEAAIFFTAKAIISPQQIKFKKKLLLFILQNYQDVYDVRNLLMLLCAVYKENRWQIPVAIGLVFEKNEINCEAIDKKQVFLTKIKKEANAIANPSPVRAKIIRKFTSYTGLARLDGKTIFYVSAHKEIKTEGNVEGRVVWSYDFKKGKVVENLLVTRVEE